MSVRDSFVAQFGEDQAKAVEAAATEHSIGIHDRRGSDPFKWAIAICIGYECMSIPRYRAYHKITASWEEIKDWIVIHAELASHDGDVDNRALLAGEYNAFVKPPVIQ